MLTKYINLNKTKRTCFRESKGIYVGYPFSAFFSTVETKIAPVMACSIQLTMHISSSKISRKKKCVGG